MSEQRPPARRRGQGELEALVLSALHAAPGPVTAGWVQQRLGGDLAYTTVMTILTRLFVKQAVTRERVGRSFAWTPATDEAGLAALRMRQVLDGEADREAVLASFVTRLPPDDERLLRHLLGQAVAEERRRAAPGREARSGARRDVRNGGGRDVRDGARREARDGGGRDVRDGARREARDGGGRDVRDGARREARDGGGGASHAPHAPHQPPEPEE